MTPASIELFTDPACPFAFSAEPVRQRLRWHYGQGLNWTPRMIVLTLEEGEAEKLARERRPSNAGSGCRSAPSPTRDRPHRSRPAVPWSRPACTLPGVPRRLLRRLRVRTMEGGLLDDPALIDAAANDASIDPAALSAWTASAEAATELQADITSARNPSASARALDHKLGGPAQERRYTAPSYIINGIPVPGFNPVEAYEVVIAHTAPHLTRRPKPASVQEVLTWADEPLATAEVALIMQTDIEDARGALDAVARFEPAGADGYWALPASSA
jgi:hypothetical protein